MMSAWLLEPRSVRVHFCGGICESIWLEVPQQKVFYSPGSHLNSGKLLHLINLKNNWWFYYTVQGGKTAPGFKLKGGQGILLPSSHGNQPRIRPWAYFGSRPVALETWFRTTGFSVMGLSWRCTLLCHGGEVKGAKCYSVFNVTGFC